MAEQRDVVGLDEVDGTDVALLGGKGAALGALRRIGGVRVPDGACVTTAAYRRVVGAAPEVAALVAGLADLDPADHERLAARTAAVRAAVEAVAVPADLVDAVTAAVERLGSDTTFAVRSSATAEDLPSASAAGQHDSALDVWPASVVDHVRRCWASLFTERAVAYRRRNGIADDEAAMAVVLQRMVPARAAGVLFTADPVTGHRRTTTVEAVRGLGEDLVSGRVRADVHTVRDDIVETTAVGAAPVLTDDEVRELVALGRRIEATLGAPQDVEWCLADDGVHVVQSRPITTLFPIPVADDDAGHVYLSVGHQQMMTDAMRPLGLSVWQMTTPRPMSVAGSRLFVDVTAGLAAPASRAALLEAFGRGDPLVRDALETLLERGDLVPSQPSDADAPADVPLPPTPPTPLAADPDLVTALVERNRASVARLSDEIRTRTGADLLAFVREDVEELRALLFAPDSSAVVMAGMEAAWWLDDRMAEWLDVRGAADVLTRSVPHNVTSEMGLALLDVADAVRPHPEVVAFLEGLAGDEGVEVLDRLAAVPGGSDAAAALRAYLDTYGVRCVGEIDITRPRWGEVPGALAPVILGNVAAFAPGEAERRVAQGRAEAAAAERDLLARVRALPDGEAKAAETAAMIARVRTFAGYREYPKYGMVSRYAAYRRALWEEADRLVAAGILTERDDIAYLTFDELEQVVQQRRVDPALVAERRAAFAADQRLTPPRVLTSDGEALQGSFRRTDLPPGALAGLPVSAGVVEGRARVVTDMGTAALAPGDILVTAFTDPSWSPLFVSIGGLVTEVGGLMTHGAVVAREYGLPAVVGVEGATRSIPDGHRIRLDGTHGTVELLPT
jgi:phosphoenolpyruvate synthase/pyruvate phosphate dikinase